MMQTLNWQCKSRHFRNYHPNNKFLKFINKPSTQENPLISTARIQNMHICTVQRVHPCFDKIATILANNTRQSPEILTNATSTIQTTSAQKCRWSTEGIREVLTDTSCVQATNLEAVHHKQAINLSKMFKTLVNFHICLNRDCCIFHSAVSNSLHWITRLIPKSKDMQKGKTITFHLWCPSFLQV